MLRLIVIRLGLAVVTLLGVSVLVFGLLQLVPGDPVRIMLGSQASPEAIAQLRAEYGLDDSLLAQYGRFLGGLLHGDLGTSIRTGEPVATEIGQRLPSTLQLAAAALLLALVFGVAVGSLGALVRGRRFGGAVQAVLLVGLAAPTFCVGLLLLLVFGSALRWFPITDDGSAAAMVLPTVALALPTGTYLARLVRTGMLEVLGADYVRTARAKGAGELRVVAVHALRNALLPLVTVVGVQFGALLTGAAVVELLFSRPGLGRYAITAIQNRDFPQIQGTILTVAVLFILVNLLVDLSYEWLDPRVRQQRTA